MRFDVSHTAPDRSRVPAELAAAPNLGKPDAEREVTMSYDPEQGMFVMDGKVYDPARVDQEVEFGATETWKVVRGTGQYAGITGGGRGTSVWFEPNDHWSSRFQGFLTTS